MNAEPTRFRPAGFGSWGTLAFSSGARVSSSHARPVAGPVNRAEPAVRPRAGLLCAARPHGPGAELAAFAALTLLRQPRRVSARSALRARSARSALLDAGFFMPGPPAPPPASRGCGGVRPTATAGAAQGGPGGLRRAWEAPSIAGRPAARAARFVNKLAAVCLSAVSAANEASWAAGRTTEKRRGGAWTWNRPLWTVPRLAQPAGLASPAVEVGAQRRPPDPCDAARPGRLVPLPSSSAQASKGRKEPKANGPHLVDAN